MDKVKVEVEITLIKHMTVEVEEYESVESKVRIYLFELEEENREKYEEFLGSARLEYIDVEEMNLRQIVRLAINAYDPMWLEPGHFEGVPLDEYDGLSDRVYRKLTPAYTVEQIAELISKESHRTYPFEEFPLSRTIHPAKEIYDYLHS